MKLSKNPLTKSTYMRLFTLLTCLTIPLLANAAPEIEVFMESATTPTSTRIPINDNATVPIGFGRTTPTTVISRTFIVNNTGDSNLIISALETTLLSLNNTSNQTGFSLGNNFPTSVIEPGGTFTFMIRFDPAAVKPTPLSAGGSSTTTVSFSTNDTDESPFNFSILANVVDPTTADLQVWQGSLEEVVTSSAVKVLNGATSAAKTAPSLGSTVLGQSVSKTFTLLNAGGLGLQINTPVTVTNVNGTQPFTVDAFSTPVTVSELGGMVSFKITLNADKTGEFSAPGLNEPETVAVSYQAAGSPKTFNFEIEGSVGPVADVAVLDGSTNIPKDGEINFGTQKVGSVSVIRKAITLKNEGGADLLLENPMVISGKSFSLISENFAKTTLTPGSTTEINLQLDTSTLGNFTGSLTFKSNDRDENPFLVNLKGLVVSSLEPEIEVSQILADGSQVALTSEQDQAIEVTTPVGSEAATLTFEVKNTGGTDLQLTSLSFNEKDFRLTTPFPKVIPAGGSDIFGIQLKNTTVSAIYTNKFQIFNTDGKGGDGVVENPFTFMITAKVGQPAAEGPIGSCFEKDNGVFAEDECLEAENLSASAVDAQGQLVATSALIVGGISKDGEPYLQETTVTLDDPITTRGVIKVAPENLGQRADIIVAGIHYSMEYPDGFAWYMLEGCSSCVKIWPYDKRNATPLLSELRPLKTVGALEDYLVIDMYSGQFIYPGFLDIFFGYRTTNGQVVFNASPIRVDIQP